MSSRRLQDMSSRRLQDMSSRRLQDISLRRLQDVFSVTIFRLPRRLQDAEDVLKTCWKRVEDTSWSFYKHLFWKTFRRCLEDVLKTSWGCLEDVLETSWRRLEDVLKTSWRRLQHVWPRRICWSWWRRLEDVFWRSEGDE